MSSPQTKLPTDSGSQSPVNEESFDALAQNLRDIEGVSDDMAVLLAKNWKRILAVFVAVMIVVWLGQEYRFAQKNKLGQAAGEFALIQNSFTSIIGTPGEGVPEEVTGQQVPGATPEQPVAEDTEAADNSQQLQTISVAKTALEQKYPDTAYKKLASLYAAMSSIESNDTANALKQLEHIQNSAASIAVSEQETTNSLTIDAFIAEVAALTEGRIAANEGRTKESREKFMNLARTANFVNAQALSSAYIISEQAEREAVIDLAKVIRQTRPELADLIDMAFSELGVKFDI